MSDLVPEGAPAEPAGELEPSWAGPSQDEWEATQQQLADYAHMIQAQQQPAAPAAPPEHLPIPDPYADDYATQFERYIESRLAPYEQFQQQVQMSQAEDHAMDLLNGHAETLGEFDRGMAWARANQIVLENGGDAVKALEQAARETRAYEQRVGEAYHQQQLQQLQGVAGAPRTLPAGVGGAQTVPIGGYGNVPNAVTTRLFGLGR